jgi:hypothetical protein
MTGGNMLGPPEFSAIEVGAALLGLGLFYKLRDRAEWAARDMIMSGIGFLIYALASRIL